MYRSEDQIEEAVLSKASLPRACYKADSCRNFALPCILSVVQDGSLSLYLMYPTPLFSRDKMESLAESVRKIIVDASS